MACEAGARWLGRSRPLRPESFHNQFGVWPDTAEALAEICGPLDSVLRVLWWLKTYPTEEEIHNHRVSAARFRQDLWPRLHALNAALPEASAFFFPTRPKLAKESRAHPMTSSPSRALALACIARS